MTQKHKSVIEDLRQAIKKKKVGLFFLKTKHARPTFRNHEYFHRTKKQDTHTLSGNNKNKTIEDWNHFVSHPTDYGIKNTYKFLETSGFMQTRQNQLQKKKFKRFGTKTEPSTYLKVTQSFICAKKDDLKSQQLRTSPLKRIKQQIIDTVDFIYVPSTQQMKKICIQIDIAPFILKCFRKCKINYRRQMTLQSYETIKFGILEVIRHPKKTYDVKDIMNLGTLTEIMDLLQNYNEGSLQWCEIIRYFFVPKQEVVQYQLDRLNDQIKAQTAIKCPDEPHLDEVHAYNNLTKVKVSTLYDYFNHSKFVYGGAAEIISVYNQHQNRLQKEKRYHQQITKWKSVASVDQSTEIQSTHTSYEKAYEKMRTRNTVRRSTPKSTLFRSTNTFITKAKVIPKYDLFQ